LDEQLVVKHLVQDAVVADPNPVCVIFPFERDTARRTWMVGKQIDGGSYALLLTTGQVLQNL
jgi:hypothetical protein